MTTFTGGIHPAQEVEVRAWLREAGRLDAHTTERVLDAVPRLVSWCRRLPMTRPRKCANATRANSTATWRYTAPR